MVEKIPKLIRKGAVQCVVLGRSFFCQEPFKRLQWLDGLSPVNTRLWRAFGIARWGWARAQCLSAVYGGESFPVRHQTTLIFRNTFSAKRWFCSTIFLFKNVWQKTWCKRQWYGGVFRRWGPSGALFQESAMLVSNWPRKAWDVSHCFSILCLEP